MNIIKLLWKIYQIFYKYRNVFHDFNFIFYEDDFTSSFNKILENNFQVKGKLFKA